jgi:hypothetical protein
LAVLCLNPFSARLFETKDKKSVASGNWLLGIIYLASNIDRNKHYKTSSGNAGIYLASFNIVDDFNPAQRHTTGDHSDWLCACFVKISRTKRRNFINFINLNFVQFGEIDIY